MPKWISSIISILIVALFFFSAQGETQPTSLAQASVLSVYDGDTITVDLNGQKESIRLIGIDTPELKRNGQDEECYAIEARDALGARLENQKITLENDPSQQNRDKYNRLLRYVILEDQNVNQWLVEEGFAEEYTYDKAYKYQNEFLTSEEVAFESNKGIWMHCN